MQFRERSLSRFGKTALREANNFDLTEKICLLSNMKIDYFSKYR